MAHQSLIEILIESLNQELNLLSMLSAEQYTAPGRGPFRSSIGQHIRHNLDHFESFFNGLDTSAIDYESRGRSELVSESTDYAIGRIEFFQKQMRRIGVLDTESVLVRKEDGSMGDDMRWVDSSIGRELQFLIGHTVHHHAIICFMLADFGIRQPDGFGVAPSTQRHNAQTR